MKMIINKIYAFIKKYYKDLIFIAALLFLAFFKLPYLVYKPGSSINVSDRIKGDNSSSGSYHMSYVSVSRANIPIYLLSYIIKDWDLVSLKEASIDNTSYSKTIEIEKLQMATSMDTAKLLACQKVETCEYEVATQKLYVAYLEEQAKSNLDIMDEILSIEGKDISLFDDIKSLILEKKIGDKVSITVKSDGKEVEKYAYVYNLNGDSVIGVGIYSYSTYNYNPSIEIESSESDLGSSGGLMMTLAIYDYLNDIDLTNGLKVMGTGTVDSLGNVGAIGGLKYKLLGAKKAGADVFFVPNANYDEAKEIYDKYKLKFDLIKVSNVDDAIDYLKNYERELAFSFFYANFPNDMNIL